MALVCVSGIRYGAYFLSDSPFHFFILWCRCVVVYGRSRMNNETMLSTRQGQQERRGSAAPVVRDWKCFIRQPPSISFRALIFL